MIGELLLQRAIANFEATYLEVGKHVEGARIERFEGGVACLSPLRHPVSNFMILKRTSKEADRSAARIACQRQVLNIYTTPETSAAIGPQLRKAGIRSAGKLNVMAGGVIEAGETVQHLRSLAIFSERLECARFMARQFFSGHTSALRESIAVAAAQSGLEILTSGDREIRTALMMCRTEATMGFYSVCVESSQRDRGLGTALMRSAAALAAREERLPTLQCEDSLEPWYRARGFYRIGEIFVFTLDRNACQAIM